MLELKIDIKRKDMQVSEIYLRQFSFRGLSKKYLGGYFRENTVFVYFVFIFLNTAFCFLLLILNKYYKIIVLILIKRLDFR